MSHDRDALELSEEEDEELMFAFEQQQHEACSPRLRSAGSDIFHSIDGVDFKRPANPMVAILDYRAAVDGRKRVREEEPTEAKLAVTPVPSSRKRKTLELPNAPAQIIRPVAKRPKSNAYERCVTAPASLMGSLSLDRTRDRHYQQIEEVLYQMEQEADKVNVPFRSASINIPNSFQPILWPGDAAVSQGSERDCSHSCSSSSSSKSWASGLELVCRRSLDVSSPVRVRFNDLALHSSAGSYTGS